MDHAQREKQWGMTMGNLLGTYCSSIVDADARAKWAYIQRLKGVLDYPNLELIAESNLIGLDEPLKTHLSIPPVVLAPLRPIEINETHLKLTMEVSAHTMEKMGIDSKTEVTGKASISLGPFGHVGIGIKANVSVNKEKERTSDYRARSEVEVHFAQGEVPEGVARVLDSILNTVDKSLELNEMLVEQKAELMRQQVDAGSVDIPETPQAVVA